LKAPAFADDGIAVTHRHIRNKIPVPALFDPGLAALSTGMRAETPGRRPGRRLQRRRRRRVVTVGVGDQDVGNPLGRETGEQGIDVFGEGGAGGDYGDLAAADHISAGPLEREGAGVARDDAADLRCHRLEPAVFEGELTAKWYVDGHGRETTRDCPRPKTTKNTGCNRKCRRAD